MAGRAAAGLGDRMGKSRILLLVLLILLDGIAFWDLRDLLKDFLIGARNRTSAKRIHAEQKWTERIGMGYIRPYLKRWHRDFAFFRGLYLADLFTLLPQYAALLIARLLADGSLNVLFCVFIGVKFLLALFLRLQQDSLHRTKYSY